jgi:hypothetical protein
MVGLQEVEEHQEEGHQGMMGHQEVVDHGRDRQQVDHYQMDRQEEGGGQDEREYRKGLEEDVENDPQLKQKLETREVQME